MEGPTKILRARHCPAIWKCGVSWLQQHSAQWEAWKPLIFTTQTSNFIIDQEIFSKMKYLSPGVLLCIDGQIVIMTI